MKKICIYVAMLVFVAAGIYGAVYMGTLPPTYDGTSLDVAALAARPDNYDPAGADGAASIIVKETMGETRAINAVTAVVFDFRGYDTMGEAFILFTAISGCLVLLRKTKTKGEGADGAED